MNILCLGYSLSASNLVAKIINELSGGNVGRLDFDVERVPGTLIGSVNADELDKHKDAIFFSNTIAPYDLQNELDRDIKIIQIVQPFADGFLSTVLEHRQEGSAREDSLLDSINDFRSEWSSLDSVTYVNLLIDARSQFLIDEAKRWCAFDSRLWSAKCLVLKTTDLFRRVDKTVFDLAAFLSLPITNSSLISTRKLITSLQSSSPVIENAFRILDEASIDKITSILRILRIDPNYQIT